jgi:hypothetical protein
MEVIDFTLPGKKRVNGLGAPFGASGRTPTGFFRDSLLWKRRELLRRKKSSSS